MIVSCSNSTKINTDTDSSSTPTNINRVADLKSRKILIGTDAQYPPMEYIDGSSQKIVGFDVDMMEEVAKLINVKIEFKNLPSFDAIFAALSNKEFDLVVSSVSITDERKKIIDFTDPYLSIGQVITVQTNNSGIKNIDDLKQAKLIGVQGGTTGEEAVKKAGIPTSQIKRYDTGDLPFQDLVNGAIDAVVADGPPSARFTEQLGGRIKVVGEPFTTEDYGIALQKGDDELRNAINSAIKELKSNGTMHTLLEKWKLQNVAKLP
jgi:ABC-type amino acid transport substrate-binding protein